MSDELIHQAADMLDRTWSVHPTQQTFRAQAKALAEAGLLNPTTNPTRSEARRELNELWEATPGGCSTGEVVDALESLGVVWAPEPRKVPARDLGRVDDESRPWPRRSPGFFDYPEGGQGVVMFDGPDAGPRCVPADELVEVLQVGCREDTR